MIRVVNNKKGLLIIILIVLTVLFSTFLFVFSSLLDFGSEIGRTDQTFLSSSLSPDGMYLLEAYRDEPGATVDFSIKVYIVSEDSEELIYNVYHESEVEILWESNSIAVINGKRLDLNKSETFDWRD